MYSCCSLSEIVACRREFNETMIHVNIKFVVPTVSHISFERLRSHSEYNPQCFLPPMTMSPSENHIRYFTNHARIWSVCVCATINDRGNAWMSSHLYSRQRDKASTLRISVDAKTNPHSVYSLQPKQLNSSASQHIDRRYLALIER